MRMLSNFAVLALSCRADPPSAAEEKKETARLLWQTCTKPALPPTLLTGQQPGSLCTCWSSWAPLSGCPQALRGLCNPPLLVFVSLSFSSAARPALRPCQSAAPSAICYFARALACNMSCWQYEGRCC